MDNFMSKLSQRINAQDTIKANFMADTAEKEKMKKQLQEYDAILQSVRNLYLKQEESSEAFTKLAEKIEGLQTTDTGKSEILEELKECISKSDEYTHRECVKVYRNVQALLDEQNKKLEESTEALKQELEAAMNGFKAPDYTEEFAALKKKVERSSLTNKLWFVLVALISAVNLACVLLIHLGLL
ncbi:MAG: hypothetical protein IKK59_04325 [Lachnospiraceae bacterium]|nr:hypothetical protein [Lachnospiraceae bacterium]